LINTFLENVVLTPEGQHLGFKVWAVITPLDFLKALFFVHVYLILLNAIVFVCHSRARGNPAVIYCQRVKIKKPRSAKDTPGRDLFAVPPGFINPSQGQSYEVIHL